MRRILLSTLGLAALLTATFTATGCSSSGDEPQRLEITGELRDTDGSPVSQTEVERYELTFVFDGDFEDRRYFSEDIDPDVKGILTDDAGAFRVVAADLELSYEWSEDELVCQDVCLASETVCSDVEEEVCAETCDLVTYESCWDECDDYGCYTYCEDVTERECWDECWIEVFTVCDDVCVIDEEQCGWITNTYTEYPALSDVVAAYASVVIVDGEEPLRVDGEPLESGFDPRCGDAVHDEDDDLQCNVWFQRDAFTLP